MPRIVLILPVASVDQACVRLPCCSPVVTTACLVPSTVAPVRHLTDVSDTHSVPSHPVDPSCDLPVYPAIPMLAPYTVIADGMGYV